MRKLLLSFFALFIVSGTAAAITPANPPLITNPSGLKYRDYVVGNGATATKEKWVIVNYTGWINAEGVKGKKFDSSFDRNQPFKFLLGVGQVIPGWDEGVQGMKEGGKRTLYIPSKLGYGARGAGADIPPNADLIFEVELVKVK